MHLKSRREDLGGGEVSRVPQPSLPLSQPVATSADSREKFYGTNFGILMLNRLDFFFFFLNQRKQANSPVISWESCVASSRYFMLERNTFSSSSGKRNLHLCLHLASPACLLIVTFTSEYYNVLQVCTLQDVINKVHLLKK